MDNNQILKKLSIALNLRHEDVREVLHLGGHDLSTSQTGARMVNPNNKNFKAFGDDELEAFLNGLITYSRGPKNAPNMVPLAIVNTIYSLGERGHVEALDSLGGLVEDVLEQIQSQLADVTDPGDDEDALSDDHDA